MRIPILLGSLPLFAALAPAQHTILFISGTADRNTLALDAPEVDLMRSDEIYEITPAPGVPYPARPFLPISLQYHYVGDLDGDAIYVEAATSGPGNTLDAVLIKAGTTGPVTPRDVFWSIASTTSLQIPGLRVSDVVRYAGQGSLEYFLTQVQLNAACGYAAASNTVNLDAIAQSAAGDIFFSQAGVNTINGIATDDGDILVIPASAITYDANGNVSAIAPGTATRIASQADLIAMVVNSGHRTSVGGVVSSSPNIELSGLEIDPNGGTWVSPIDSNTYPNLLFCWSDFHNDGAILSTAGGGTIAVINGVPMGSTVATLGDQLGYQPDSTGTFGPNGLALIPQQEATFTLLNYPRNQHPAGSTTQTQLQLQTSGGTPFGFTVLAWSPESAVANGTFPALPAIPPFTGEFGILTPIILGLYANDGLGNTVSEMFLLDTSGLHGLNLAAQALDFTTFRLSTPSATTFL
ncbi:MAG: hypothetical protein KF830_09960 [Planctomycetes bacterium]|nr:hypothetical protein [Planctomycetota bacterium]